MRKKETFCVYVVYNDTDQALYIGLSEDVTKRLRTHERKAEWWKDHKIVDILNCKSKDEMIKTEKRLIKELSPLYNQTAGGETCSGSQNYPNRPTFRLTLDLIKITQPPKKQIKILPPLCVYDKRRLIEGSSARLKKPYLW